MNQKQSAFEILTKNRGVWSATPWDYSSSRWIRFHKNKNADLFYGYGQTIFALIKSEIEILSENKLRITYLQSKPLSFFKGFKPNTSNNAKEIDFSINEDKYEFVESIVNRDWSFEKQLVFSQSIYPDELKFPYEIPLEYYGFRDCSKI